MTLHKKRKQKDVTDDISTASDADCNGKSDQDVPKKSKKKQKPDDSAILNALKTQLADAEKKAEEAQDRLLRLGAEFENCKKRNERDMMDFKKYANESILRDMLGIADNLERALTPISDDTAAEDTPNGEASAGTGFIDGVKLTYKALFTTFEKYGVTPILSKGEPFDPAFHQAMMKEASADTPKNSVLSELQQGYMFHDRLLRPAMVIVSTGKAEKKKAEKKKAENET